MTTVIEQMNQKVDKILQIVESIDIRLVNLEIMVNTIETEIKNKTKSSKRNKQLIHSRLNEPLKLEYKKYEPGSFDEWVVNTQLPKVKKDLEEINRLKEESLKIEDKKKKQIIQSESETDE